MFLAHDIQFNYKNQLLLNFINLLVLCYLLNHFNCLEFKSYLCFFVLVIIILINFFMVFFPTFDLNLLIPLRKED